jgi:hypothetical protein
MRCLGRLVLAFILLLLVAAGWLYRDELARWVRGRLHPATEAARVGHPSQVAMASATAKGDSLLRFRPDSILLTPDEMASLIASGARFLPAGALDSISVELGDRTIRIRTLVRTTRLPKRLLDMIPVTPDSLEEVIAAGTLTPVRAGVAELALTRVLVRGLPVPSEMVARIIGKVTGKADDGRLEIVMPASIIGFRVRPTGVTIYRNGSRK